MQSPTDPSMPSPSVSSPATAPRRKKHLRNWFVSLALLITTLVAVALLASKTLLETQLKAILVSHGITGLDFSLEALTFKGITFKNITYGPFRLQALHMGYVPLGLLQGDVSGLQAGDITLKNGETEITLGNVTANITERDGDTQKGEWVIDNIVIHNGPIEIPVLTGKGTFSYTNDTASGAGILQDTSNTYSASFALSYPFSGAAVATLNSASFPWNEGRVRIGKVAVPLQSQKPINATVTLENVSVNALLKQITGERASATGKVSGSIPVTLNRDGTFILHQGTLKTGEAGTIQLQPEAIPGDNQQVALVRDILKNFHYTVLSLSTDTGKDDKLSMLLSLEGNNPDVYNGREVKLHVKLTGDLLDFLQQSMLSISDPQQLMKQGGNDKK